MLAFKKLALLATLRVFPSLLRKMLIDTDLFIHMTDKTIGV
jgi:hypothetical protein